VVDLCRTGSLNVSDTVVIGAVVVVPLAGVVRSSFACAQAGVAGIAITSNAVATAAAMAATVPLAGAPAPVGRRIT
jgi:hypothetical protein